MYDDDLECERNLPSDFARWAAREQDSIENTLAKIKAKSAQSKLNQAMKKHEFANFNSGGGMDRLAMAELESRGKIPVRNRDDAIRFGDADGERCVKFSHR